MAGNAANGRAARVAAAMRNLRTDAATGEVIAALDAKGVRTLLLKGSTLADWYACDAVRVYQDGDLWVRPSDLEVARSTLRALGFEPALEARELPSWWDQHAITWERRADGTAIDLHRAIDGVGAHPELAWDTMWRLSVPFEVGGRPVRRLSAPGRALNVVLHSAQHGLADPKATAHVEAALANADRETWLSAVALAEQLDAFSAFVTALRAVPAGARLADELGLASRASVLVALVASGAPPVSLGIMQISETQGLRARFCLLISKVAPPPVLLKAWWPPARRSRLLLTIGYLYRPFWLVRRAPAGFRAWRAAKDEAAHRLRQR